MVHLTTISHNIKTGPIPVSTSSKQNCPDSCPFKKNGCYAEVGPMAIHWNKVSNGSRGSSYDDFCDQVKRLRKGTLWRHNQAGDLEGENLLIDLPKLKQLVAANKGKLGFTYTHKPVLVEDIKGDLTIKEKQSIVNNNIAAIKYANENGFTVNLSGNNIDHAKKLVALNIAPVVSVVPMDAKTTKDFVVCPAVTNVNTNCMTCGLCQKQHKKIVAFPAHGSAKAKAQQTSNKY